jgi:hypothetical protein
MAASTAHVSERKKYGDFRESGPMFCHQGSRTRLLVYALAGIALGTLVIGPTTPANAAPNRLMATTATVISPTVNIRGEPCVRYPVTRRTVQEFIDAAEAAQKKGKSVCLAPDLRLTASAPLTVREPAVLDFNGAKIVRAPSTNDWLITVVSPGVSILDVTLMGNRPALGHGGGLLCEAAGCRLSNVHVTGMTTYGIEARHPGSSLAISRSSVDDTVNSKPSLGDGIRITSGARVHVSSTSATHNSGDGFQFVKATAGSSISGSSSENIEAGLSVLDTPHLSIGRFDSNADWHYGVAIWTSVDLKVNSVTVTATGSPQGALPSNGNGSAIQLFWVSGSVFTSLHLSGMPGYGLALSGATKNVFRHVNVARDGKGESNPAVELEHGAADNAFQAVSIADTSVGVDLGSSGVKNNRTGRAGNVGNTFTTLTLVGNTYAAIDIEGGNHNVFRTVNATDVGSDFKRPDRAAIRLNFSTTSHNKIDVYNTYINSSYVKWDTPAYLVYADSKANHNSVHLGTIEGGYSVAKWHDANGTNKFN